ncbi:MAG TPA: hypothetical protein VHW96_18485 [Solirubrobacteraceae bacterium]|jgi:hypothetical protein|nr:hypothetical protein [Solirubrobacteraceae bacterium]
MRAGRVDRRTTVAAVLTVLAALALSTAPALAARRSGAATPRPTFKPRLRFAMGLLPIHGAQEVATSPSIPVLYHGGVVMRNVTIHTIFWAPDGDHYDASPGSGAPGYVALIQQFFTDVAHDSGSTTNIFSLLNQFGDESGDGSYQIHYDPAVDSVADTHAYPAAADQCPSPSGVATCVTDLQVQREVDRIIGTSNPAARGLTNVYFVLLPPDVDECITIGSCGTTAFAGYHSAFSLGHGLTVYSAIPDPQIEFTPAPGSDPEGNPEAESTIDTVAHETVEAITDPVGTGWMDPNGFETADKCENGPQQGTPLGYASDGSPYNQLIDGHQYLIQDIWSNARSGCVQSSTTVASIPALHALNLRQFSSQVSGNLGAGRRLPVALIVSRAGAPVAVAQGESRADGSWGPLTLRGRNGDPHAVGDDRDVVEVFYGLARGSPSPDLIETGDGGNPFTESGFTGWFDLDHGYAVSSGGGRTIYVIGPCGQTGVLSLRIGASPAPSPTEQCETETDFAPVVVHHVGLGTPVTMTSEDNRAGSALEPNGALVRMTIGLGEPGSVTAVPNNQLPIAPTGFPTCTAFLRIQTVRCSGLVPRAPYHLLRGGRTLGHGRAGSAGAVTIGGLRLHGGDVVTLANAAGRRLTSLHVAHLRVDLVGNETAVASGSCQAGDYWGAPVSKPPVSAAIGLGIGGTGTICPSSGRAKGLPAAELAQTDDFSGGQTATQVPQIESTAPLQDETLYGSFVASAQSGLPGPHGSISATGVPVALTITPAGSRHRVLHVANVDTPRGVDVSALSPGPYVATWVLHDASGDTRTVTTRFVNEA